MYCHVYGPIYGLLEHCVQNVQRQTTEGTSAHVNTSHPSGRQNPSPDVWEQQQQQQHAIAVCHTSPGRARTEPADCRHNTWFSVIVIILLLLIGEDELIWRSQRNWNKSRSFRFFCT